MSAAIRCDRRDCTSTRDASQHGWIRLELPVPVTVRGQNTVIRDACSTECAHWLVDELAELMPLTPQPRRTPT